MIISLRWRIKRRKTS